MGDLLRVATGVSAGRCCAPEGRVTRHPQQGAAAQLWLRGGDAPGLNELPPKALWKVAGQEPKLLNSNLLKRNELARERLELGVKPRASILRAVRASRLRDGSRDRELDRVRRFVRPHR
jgi:hypothetical protein